MKTIVVKIKNETDTAAENRKILADYIYAKIRRMPATETGSDVSADADSNNNNDNNGNGKGGCGNKGSDV